MYDFQRPADADPDTVWADILAAARGLLAGEPDGIANMANLSALLWEMLPELNWAGFYRAIGDELVLGPFQGRPACIRIPVGQGVCGTAAASGAAQRVDDVHAFPGHIACDAASASELAVPVKAADGRVLAVLDLDSPRTGRFTAADVDGAEGLCALLAQSLG